MEPKLDKSPVKADNGNPPVDSASTDARISQLEEDNAKLLHMVNLIQGFLKMYINIYMKSMSTDQNIIFL
jgi:hypothetical protein